MVGDGSSRRNWRFAVGSCSTDFERMSFRIPSHCKISDKLIYCHTGWWGFDWGLQNVFIQADNTGIAENQEEIFQGFREPKAFHPIRLWWVGDGNIINCGVCDIRVRNRANGGEHIPCLVEEDRISSDPIEVKDRFDGFWPT